MVLKVSLGWFFGMAILVSAAWAEETVASAHEVVNDATQKVMAVVSESGAYMDEDPERYYQQVQDILDPVIDFRGFARSVMGPYASSERYRSLDETGRQRLREQLDAFTDVMRVGLVRTYSKGLLVYGDSRIEVFAAAEEDVARGRAAVRQLVYNNQPEPYVLIYHMGLAKSGEWQLRNIIIEGVNLGEIYRSQFEASARKNNGDIDAVIASWTAVEVETEES
tara:strand:- start:303946 stop:304614 length:669 start_codon:yes stop_codon:yes gene_type:complete